MPRGVSTKGLRPIILDAHRTHPDLSPEALADVLAKRGYRLSGRTVRRHLDAADKARSNGNGVAPPKVAPAAVTVAYTDEASDVLVARVVAGFVAIGESDDVPVCERLEALKQAGYFGFLLRFGEPPKG